MYDIRYLKALRLKKNYQAASVFLVENYKVLQEMVLADKRGIKAIFTTAVFFEKQRSFFETNRLTPLIVVPSILKSLSQLTTNEQVIAVMEKPSLPPFMVSEGVTLVLDAIRNPMNLGTIIRTADWFGIRNIVCSKDTVDLYNPKVLQAAMGSWLRVRVYYTDLLPFLETYPDVPVYVTAIGKGGNTAMPEKRSGAHFWVFGNESVGVSEALQAYAHRFMEIPRIGGAESLNVAVAVGIMLSRLV